MHGNVVAIGAPGDDDVVGKGGVMVPQPDLLVPLVLDATGESVLLAAWPPGAPSGFTFALQAWITDAAGPVGFSATNGVLGSVP